MKKYIIALMLVAFVSFGAAQAKAATLDDLWSMVANLTQQVSDLKVQLSGIASKAMMASQDSAMSANKAQSMQAMQSSQAAAPAQDVSSSKAITPSAQASASTSVQTTQAASQPGQPVIIPFTQSAIPPADPAPATSWFCQHNPTDPKCKDAITQGPITQSPSTSIAVTFTKTLSKGQTDPQIVTLQNFLIQKGYLAAGNNSGLYGPMTVAAVKAFQGANEISDDGTVVGAKTQAAIQALSQANALTFGPIVLGPITPQLVCINLGTHVSPPWIKVTSPNGGEVFTAGQQITVTWNTCNIPSGNKIQFKLVSTLNGTIQTILPSTGGLSYSFNDGTEVITLPSAAQMATNGWTGGAYYKVEAVPDTYTFLDASDNVFTINSGGTSLVPFLATAVNAGYPNQSASANTANLKIGSFVVQNQSTSDTIRLTNLQVMLAGTALLTPGSGCTSSTSGYSNVNGQPCTSFVTTANFSNLKTSEPSGSGSTPIAPAIVNAFAINTTLAPGATKTFDVYIDAGVVPSGTLFPSLTATGYDTSTNAALSQNGNNVPITGQTTTFNGTTTTNCMLNAPSFVNSGSTSTQYIAAGTTSGVTDATKAEFNFSIGSGCGNATITELGFKEGTNADILTKVRVGAVNAVVAHGAAYLYGLNIPVANGGAGAFVDAFASYAPVGPLGLATTTTGDIFSRLNLTYVKYQVGTSTFMACATGGTPNGSSCTATLGMPVLANQVSVVGSKPAITVTQPNSVLTTGNVEAIDVTVTADANGPIKITQLPINTTVQSGSGITFGTGMYNPIVVKDASNTVIQTSGASFTSTAGNAVTISFIGTGYTIGAGQSQTFKIFLPVTSLGAGAGTKYVYSMLGTPNSFQWLDVAGGAGYPSQQATVGYIYNYPTNSSMIHN